MSEERYITARPSVELLSVFMEAAELQCAQDEDRRTVMNDAMSFVDSLSDEELEEKLKLASRTKVKEYASVELPSSFKIKVDSTLYDSIIEKFKDVFKIERVKTPFFIRVIVEAYIIHNREENRQLGLKNSELDQLKIAGHTYAKMSDVELINRITMMQIKKTKEDIEKLSKIEKIITEQ